MPFKKDPAIMSFAPGLVCLSDIVQGDTAIFTIAVEYEDGSPYDLTGLSVEMHIRRADDSLVISLTIGNGVAVDGNVITISIPSSTTAIMADDVMYSYDIEIRDGDVIRTILSGPVNVMKQITV